MRRSFASGAATAVALTLVFSAPAAAQQSLPITQGQVVTGSITGEDTRLAEGHGYDVYAFQGAAGETVVATMRSSAFDTYLVLARNAGVITEELVTDDDGAGGTDSRVALTLPATGTYLLLARGLDASSTGSYTLELGTLTRGVAAVTPIQTGETRVSNLDASDDFQDDLSYYEIFTFEGRPGERYEAKMRSSQFDTYIDMGTWDGSTLSPLGANDDGFDDGTTDSRLVITLPRNGTYAIRASSLRPQQAGQFTLSLEALGPLPEPTVTGIRAGETLVGQLTEDDGQLSDDSFVDLYTFTGTPGERITVTMRSGDFDTYLAVGTSDGDGGFVELASDDDGAGGTDSQVVVSVPADGTLVIQANALSAGDTGAYTLSVQRGG